MYNFTYLLLGIIYVVNLGQLSVQRCVDEGRDEGVVQTQTKDDGVQDQDFKDVLST